MRDPDTAVRWGMIFAVGLGTFAGLRLAQWLGAL